MSDQIHTLISQLTARQSGVAEDQIAEILRQAREEALAEVKAILKDLMVRAILNQALDEAGLPTVSPEIPQVREAAAEQQTQIQQEIEAIRRKIAENEQFLSQLTSSPPPPAAPSSAGLPSMVSEEDRGAEDGDGYYVYGIVESKYDLPGDGWPEQGIDPAHPVYTLPCRAIQAVVSQVTLKEFGQEALEANLQDPVWLETRVRTHQSVLDSVATHCTLIPMKFCTIYRSEDRVQEMLAAHYDDFIAALMRLSGKQEWGVKIYLDGETLARRVEEISERVRSLKAELAGKSSGKAYFVKKKLEETLAAEMERVNDERAQSSHDHLAGCAEESRVNPLQSKEITHRKDEMVLNGVYLVDQERIEAFRAALEGLEKENGYLGFHYELTGPWPPYNFVTIGMSSEDAEIAANE